MDTDSSIYESISSFGWKMIRAFGVYLGILLVVLYAGGWAELIGNGEVDPTGFWSIVSTIPYSLKYFLGILAYGWWFLILIGSLLLSLVTALLWKLAAAIRDRAA